MSFDIPLENLHIVGCKQCGFVWNEAHARNSVSFDVEYEQDGTYSELYRGHLDFIAAKVISSVPAVEELRILEIGCAQGQFFRHLAVADQAMRITQFDGFDPAYRQTSTPLGDNATIHPCYFDRSTVNRLSCRPNLIILRHVLGYLQDPVGFFSLLREVIADGEATIFVESPDIAWVLGRRSTQDIFYETASYYTPSSLGTALRLAGFEMFSSEPVFEGQYFIAAARASASYSTREFPDLMTARLDYAAYWRTAVAEARSRGPVAVWGAAAKGIGFAQLVDPGANWIELLVDINPAKQGRFVPMTGHRIVSAEEAVGAGVKTILVANPVYRDEVDALYRALGGSAEVIGLEGMRLHPFPDSKPLASVA